MCYRGQNHVLQGTESCVTGDIIMCYRGHNHVLQGTRSCVTGDIIMCYRGHKNKCSSHSPTQQVEAQAFTVQGWHLLTVNQTGTSVQAQDRPQLPQQSPVFQTPHRQYRTVPLRHWQSDNRMSTAVLPHLQATQKGNPARPHFHSPQALR